MEERLSDDTLLEAEPSLRRAMCPQEETKMRHYLNFYLTGSGSLLKAMPALRSLRLDDASGPVAFNKCMAAIGELQHLNELRLTAHPGGNANIMSQDEFRESFAPFGIEYWKGWAINDINQRLL